MDGGAGGEARLVLRRWLDRKIIWFYPEGWGFQTFKAVNHFVKRKSYAGTQYIKHKNGALFENCRR